MNLSGKAVRYWLNDKKLDIQQSITVVDDLALPFGRLRLRLKGSDAGHNGLKDIQKILNTAAYPRLRMGIGDDFAKGQQVDYVLGKFTSEEEAALPTFVKAACECLLDAATLGLERSMGMHNKK
jgi:PTH1 family peptidyl-tRNA hydrolase